MSHSERDIERDESIEAPTIKPPTEALLSTQAGRDAPYRQLVKDIVAELQPPPRQKPVGEPGKATVIGAVGRPDFSPSPSLDPDMVKALAGEQWDEDAQADLGSMVALFTDMTQSLTHINDAFTRLKADPTRTPDARVIAAADYAHKKQQAVATAIDAQRDWLTKSIAAAEAQLASPLEGDMGSLGAEIRSVLRSMEPGDRRSVINEALKTGDQKIMRAMLGGMPAVLTNLLPAEAENYTRQFNEQSNPRLTRRLTLKKAALDLLDRNWPIFAEGVQKAMGSKWEHVAKIREKADEANKALAR